MVSPEIPTETHIVSEEKEALRPQSFYNQRLRPMLPAEVFEPAPIRLLWFAGYCLVTLVCFLTIANFELLFPTVPLIATWAAKAGLGVVVGICIGALGFFAHEVMHGSVVRSRRGQEFFGFLGFMPWFIAPTFWKFWHNQLHHGKTQAIITDPDAFPTMKIYKHSKFMNAMFPYTPGSGHLRSYTYFFFWFSFHVLVAQTYLRFRNSVFEKLNHRRVTVESAGQFLIWGAILLSLGPTNLFWTWVIPFLTQNYFAMSYIATNHNLSPLTRVNDPLVNSLTVTNVPVFEFIALNFGYHVEHHVFPTINGIHAKKIHKLLRQEFPQDFLFMPKFQAMKALYRTARIYKNSQTLINPETGATYDVHSKAKPINAHT
ncbi:MAG: fatty acid desaturase [Bdellovibrionia bacterium]